MRENCPNSNDQSHRDSGVRSCCAVSRSHRVPSRGFTLIELLAVVTVMAIVTTAVIPYFRPSDVDQLRAAAQIVAADLADARNLAVTNGSNYTITCDFTNNYYYLSHTGTNTALNVLPPTPYGLPTDTANRRTTHFSKLPVTGVKLHNLIARGTSSGSYYDVTFTALGNTVRLRTTEFWLRIGTSTNARYIPVIVNPTTGLAKIGDVTAYAPTLASSS